MAILHWTLGGLVGLAVIVVAAGQLGAFGGRQPADLGVRDGRLKPPSKTPNSVSSQSSLWTGHPQRMAAQIAPLSLRDSGPATIDRIAEVVGTMPGAQIVERREDYLYVQFTTRWLGFVDDCEFWFDPAANVVQVRSASRLGRKDLGVNRQRVEAIRAALAAPRPAP